MVPGRRARSALLGLGGLAAIAALVPLLWSALRPSHPALARAREGFARPVPGGAQEIALLARGGEYEPNVIHARAGVPLRLQITRHERHSCSEELLVPDLGVELALPTAGTEPFTLPAAPRGEYLFTCGSKMVKGVLLLE